MKRIISSALAAMLLVGLVLSLAACSSLSGTYTEAVTGEISIKFSVFGSITLLDGNGKKIIKGDYEIEEDGRLDIDFDDDDIAKLSDAKKAIARLYDGEHSFSQTEKDGKKYITIGVTTFKKK